MKTAGAEPACLDHRPRRRLSRGRNGGARPRAQAEADGQGTVGLHKLIADELLQLVAAEGGSLTSFEADLSLQPGSGQVFALAVHELALNPVEHGALGGGGMVEVRWSVEPEDGDTPEFAFNRHEELEQEPT